MLISLIRENRETFYDYSSNRKKPPNQILAIFSAISVIFAITSNITAPEILSLVISVFSILIGFGFTAQFFLVDKNFNIEGRDKYIETSILEEKLRKLSKELFVNVSYFNLISLFLVIICLFNVVSIDKDILNKIGILEEVNDILLIARYAGRFFVAFLMMESIFTFYRITQRTHYLFKKIRETV